MHQPWFGAIIKPIPAPPAVTGVALMSARYWRFDNLVKITTGVQFFGMTFYNGLGASITPVSITTNEGDQTANYDRNKADGDSTLFSNGDGVTYVNFDFGSDITPAFFGIWGWEWDTDYIESGDISYSDDGVTWTKIGEFNVHHDMANINGLTVQGYDNQDKITREIWGLDSQLIHRPHLAILQGRQTDKQVIPQANLRLVSGRHSHAQAINDARLYVITKPV